MKTEVDKLFTQQGNLKSARTNYLWTGVTPVLQLVHRICR